jgi:hypothetical protein
MRLEGLDQLKTPNDFSGNRISNLLVCNILPQPATLVPPAKKNDLEKCYDIWEMDAINHTIIQ